MAFKDLFVKSSDSPEIPTSLSNMARRYNPSAEPLPQDDFDTTGFDLKGVVPISDIYTKEAIADLSRSIFKVEEIRAVVPSELSTDARKKTVLGILGVSGLDIAGLTADADLRVATLQSAQATFTARASQSVQNDEAEIKDLEAQIDVLKQNIDNTRKTQEAQDAAINKELAQIDNLVQFIS